MNINATILGQMIAFSIFTWFCLKYVWPPLIKAMEERQNRLAAGLQDADKAQEALKSAEENAQHQLKEAKGQAAALIEQANKRAEKIIEEAKGQAIAEGEKLKKQIDAEIKHDIDSAKEQLKSEISSLVLLATQKVLGSEIDISKHEKLLSEFVADN